MEAAMNNMHRRCFKAFINSGGDPNDLAQMEGLMHFVQGLVIVFPDKRRRVLDLILCAEDEKPYTRVARQLGLSMEAVYQHVSRGGAQLEEEIRRRYAGQNGDGKGAASGPMRR
jgi:DNA-directed RNA polymerase specialized sigma subunit